MNKLERIEETKRRIGYRNDRKIKKYSEKFNKMFNFYLSIYRSGIVTFCGIEVKTPPSDTNGVEGRYAFREYDNGRYRKEGIPPMRHPNIFRGILIGKKGWGLWVEQWTQGIVDWSFTKEEIVEEFTSRNIEIPEPLMLEWDKLIIKHKAIRAKKHLQSLKESRIFVI